MKVIIMADFIGGLAAFLTTASFLPQAILVLRTRNTEGLSLIMYAMFTAGITCWLAYGLMIGSLPITIANAITIVLASIILTIKIRNTVAVRRGQREPLI
ncbi:hypothetical protein GCM10011503_26110 [Henriciella pelagia]|uniref:Glutathione synthetase n=2 Tax=Hyphomonadaceae TaxID=69657 RepID=A0ABQ1JS38_9PROT|nr:hypothetical protein GCM10011503_26110 [Henriciella pelagia]